MLRLFTLFLLALELRTGLLFFQNTRLVNLVPLALRTRNTARLLLTFFWFEGGGAPAFPSVSKARPGLSSLLFDEEAAPRKAASVEDNERRTTRVTRGAKYFIARVVWCLLVGVVL